MSAADWYSIAFVIVAVEWIAIARWFTPRFAGVRWLAASATFAAIALAARQVYSTYVLLGTLNDFRPEPAGFVTAWLPAVGLALVLYFGVFIPYRRTR